MINLTIYDNLNMTAISEWSIVLIYHRIMDTFVVTKFHSTIVIQNKNYQRFGFGGNSVEFHTSLFLVRSF